MYYQQNKSCEKQTNSHKNILLFLNVVTSLVFFIIIAIYCSNSPLLIIVNRSMIDFLSIYFGTLFYVRAKTINTLDLEKQQKLMATGKTCLATNSELSI